MIAVHLLLVCAAVLALAAARPALGGWLAGTGRVPLPVAALRRLWRKEAVSAGLSVAVPCAAIVLACDAGAVLLVPTVPLALPAPFADLFAVFGLLAGGRVVSALGAVEMGGTPGGTGASRTTRFLVAAGPVAVLLPLIVAGVTGSGNLGGALAALRESAGSAVHLPMLLAACAVAVLGWADLSCGGGAAGFAGGRALALLRVSAVVRRVAWLHLVAALLPPVAPNALGPGVGIWAGKLVVLTVALAVADTRLHRPRDAGAAPALATLLGLLGALLALTGGPA